MQYAFFTQNNLLTLSSDMTPEIRRHELVNVHFYTACRIMTKLYYHPHSSAAASFIAAVAAGVHIEVEQIDFATKKTTSGADFFTINPKGNVPALVLDDGTVLNEGSAVLQYIADQVILIRCRILFQLPQLTALLLN